MNTRSTAVESSHSLLISLQRGLIIVEATAVVGLVAAGGDPLWRILRVVFVVVVSVALVRILPTATSRGRAWLAVVVGLVGTAAGMGIGVWHLTHGSLSVRTVAGLLSLATGLLLLGTGAVVLIRRLHRWRRLWALPAGLVAGVFVLYPSTMALIATNVPPSTIARGTPADLGLGYTDVTLRTSDGVPLSGWYIPSTNGAAVVLLHGSGGSTRTGLLSRAAVLARHGYGALLLDSRGHGRSGGVGMDWGWYGDTEVAAAADYLLGRPDVTTASIGVVGLSMGGEEAVGATAANPRVGAVVAEGVTGRVLSDHGWLPKPAGWVNLAAESLMFPLADVLTSAQRPTGLRTALARAGTPTLLIAAGQSKDEQRAALYFQQAAPDAVEIWVAADSGHTGSQATHPDEWAARVTGFLDRFLAVS